MNQLWTTSPCLDWDAQDEIDTLHRALLTAGADAISTNTPGAQPSTLADLDIPANAAQLNEGAARSARAICDEFSTPDRPRKVLGAIGSTFHLLFHDGGGEERFQRLQAEYRLQAAALLRGGADILHLERCMDLQNARAAIAAIASLQTQTPVLITAEIEGMGALLDGTPPEAFLDFARSIPNALAGLSGNRVWLLPILDQLLASGKPPDALFLNVTWPCGDPSQIETPESFAAALAPIAQSGAVPILGIGTIPDPAYIRALTVLS